MPEVERVNKLPISFSGDELEVIISCEKIFRDTLAILDKYDCTSIICDAYGYVISKEQLQQAKNCLYVFRLPNKEIAGTPKEII